MYVSETAVQVLEHSKQAIFSMHMYKRYCAQLCSLTPRVGYQLRDFFNDRHF